MNITSIAQYTAAISILIPLFFVIKYWITQSFKKDFRANIIGLYVCIMVLAQIVIFFLAFEGKSNIIPQRIFLYIEVILVSYVFLSYQFKETLLRSLFTVAILLLILAIDYNWGEFSSNPIEVFMVQALLFTILGMLTIPEIRMENDYENGIYYFIFAILIYAVNNLIGSGFIQLAPSFSLNVHAVATIIKHLLIAKAFHVFAVNF